MKVISIVIFVFVAWGIFILFEKNNAKRLLLKYQSNLFWIDSNNILKILSKLKEINKKRGFEKEDIVTYRHIIIFFNGSIVVILITVLIAVIYKALI